MFQKCWTNLLIRNVGKQVLSIENSCIPVPGNIRLLSSASALDPVQESLLSEPCILVDKHDNIIGQASKKECHKIVDGTSPLHRAFSLFIFNEEGSLLLQKRSDTKITFPSLWTNSCCSHPLMQGDEPDGVAGVKLAASRRSVIELGIPEDQLKVENMHYLTRILYQAPSTGGEWGEHELDYIIFMKANVHTNINPDEVSDTAWIPRHELTDFMKEVHQSGGGVTPWFHLVSQHLLHDWWKNLDNIHKFTDHEKIHSFY